MKKKDISMNSRAKLYHRAECRYAKQIKIKNRMEISRSQAEELGYCVCPHCDGMRALYSFEKKAIEKYVGKENLFVDMVGDWLYVRELRLDVGKLFIRKKRGNFFYSIKTTLKREIGWKMWKKELITDKEINSFRRIFLVTCNISESMIKQEK